MFANQKSLLVALMAAASTGGTAVDVRAQAAAISQPVAVLELFTSQGCSSCPPADTVLKSYVGRGDIIALSFSVDYWDYLGWKDTLASPKYTRRQRAYAVIRGDGQVYTPQVVVNGGQHVVGSSTGEIEAAIKSSSAEFAKQRVPVRVSMAGGELSIDLGGVTKTANQAIDGTVWLAVVQPEATVAVRGGENGGRKLTYHNVVRDFTSVGNWSGAASTIKIAESSLNRAPDQQVIVLLQGSKNGLIIGAGRL